MSDSGDSMTPEQTWTPKKGTTQGVFDPSQVAYSGALNYAGMPTEYYDKSGSMIGYLGKGDNVMSTSGLNIVDPYGKPASIQDKHSLYQLTDEQGNLLYNNPNYDGGGDMWTTQDTGSPATRQLSSMINMNAPSPGIFQDPLFRNFLISAATMGGAAALAPAAGASGLPAGMTGADLANMGLTASDLSAMGVTSAELGGAGLASTGALAGLTGADLLKYGSMGLKGIGALSSLAGLAGSGLAESGLAGSGGGPGRGSTGGGGSGGGTTNVYNSSGPWNAPITPGIMTVGQANQRPITSGLENLEMLDPSTGKSSTENNATQPNFFTYGTPVATAYPVPAYKNGGGVLQQFKGGGHVPEFITGTTGHYVKGRGDGQSDDIPAMLADGEFVFDSSSVSTLGNGSSDAGAKLLDAFRESLREHTRSAPKDKIPPKAAPLEYMRDALQKVNLK